MALIRASSEEPSNFSKEDLPVIMIQKVETMNQNIKDLFIL